MAFGFADLIAVCIFYNMLCETSILSIAIKKDTVIKMYTTFLVQKVVICIDQTKRRACLFSDS